MFYRCSPERYYGSDHPQTHHGYKGRSQYVTTSYTPEEDYHYPDYPYYQDDAASVYSSYSRTSPSTDYKMNSYRRDGYSVSDSGNCSRSSSQYPSPTFSQHSRGRTASATMHEAKRNEIAQLLHKVERERYTKQLAEAQATRMWDACGRPRTDEPIEKEPLFEEAKKNYKTQINEDGMLVLNDIKREDTRPRPKRRVKSKPYRTALDENGNLTLAPKMNQAAARHARDRYTFKNPNSEYETTVLDQHGRPIPNPLTHAAAAASYQTNVLLRRKELEHRLALQRLHAHAQARAAAAQQLAAHQIPRATVVENPNPMAGYIGVNSSMSRNNVPTGLYHEKATQQQMIKSNMMKKFEKGIITAKGRNENWRTQLNHASKLNKQDPTKSVDSGASVTSSSIHENVSDKSSVDGNVSSKASSSLSGSRALDITRLGNGVVIVRGALSESKQLWLWRQAKKQLSSESKGPIYEPLTKFEEGLGMAGMMNQILKKVRTQFPEDFPESSPTHVQFTENNSLIGSHWHSDEDGEENNKKPLLSVCIGNSYSFGYRPIWNNFDVQTLEKMGLLAYKSQSYMCPPDFVDIHSGDVIIWGGVSRFLVHNVERVYPGSSSVAANTRYEINFRDCGCETEEKKTEEKKTPEKKTEKVDEE